MAQSLSDLKTLENELDQVQKVIDEINELMLRFNKTKSKIQQIISAKRTIGSEKGFLNKLFSAAVSPLTDEQEVLLDTGKLTGNLLIWDNNFYKALQENEEKRSQLKDYEKVHSGISNRSAHPDALL